MAITFRQRNGLCYTLRYPYDNNFVRTSDDTMASNRINTMGDGVNRVTMCSSTDARQRCGMCQSTCTNNSECKPGMVCSAPGNQVIPGCRTAAGIEIRGGTSLGTRFCYTPSPSTGTSPSAATTRTATTPARAPAPDYWRLLEDGANRYCRTVVGKRQISLLDGRTGWNIEACQLAVLEEEQCGVIMWTNGNTICKCLDSAQTARDCAMWPAAGRNAGTNVYKCIRCGNQALSGASGDAWIGVTESNILVMAFVTLIIFVGVLAVSWMTYCFSHRKTISLSSWRFNIVVGVGGVLWLFGNLLRGWATAGKILVREPIPELKDADEATEFCMLGWALINIAITLIIGPIVLKLYRVHTIFNASEHHSTAIHDKTMGIYLAMMLLLDVAVIFLSQRLPGSFARETKTSDESINGQQERWLQCKPNADRFNFIQYGWKSALMLCGSYYAYVTCSIELDEVNEGRELYFILFVQMMCGAFTLMTWSLSLPYQEQYMVEACLNSFVVVVIVVMLFKTSLSHLCRMQDSDAELQAMMKQIDNTSKNKHAQETGGTSALHLQPRNSIISQGVDMMQIKGSSGAFAHHEDFDDKDFEDDGLAKFMEGRVTIQSHRGSTKTLVYGVPEDDILDTLYAPDMDDDVVVCDKAISDVLSRSSSAHSQHSTFGRHSVAVSISGQPMPRESVRDTCYVDEIQEGSRVRVHYPNKTAWHGLVGTVTARKGKKWGVAFDNGKKATFSSKRLRLVMEVVDEKSGLRRQDTVAD